MNVIEVKNLTKTYGKQRGIEDLTFEVKPGEIFGFIGPNGAGKSTTIKTLLNLLHPTSGSAEIFGLNTTKDSALIAKDIGYLPSEVFYYDGMKVKDLLNYSASFYKTVDRNRMKELCTLLELDLNRKIEELSYGNRKKVGIVQGLLHQPKLIILDEPTSGLDPVMQNRFFDLLRQENENGATVFFSSHILSEVQKLCHKVAIIKEGRIIRNDDVEAVKKENYKKITVESPQNIFDSLKNIDGIAKIEVENEKVDFLFRGDVNRLIFVLKDYNINNLVIENPNLEEIFLHYYQ